MFRMTGDTERIIIAFYDTPGACLMDDPMRLSAKRYFRTIGKGNRWLLTFKALGKPYLVLMQEAPRYAGMCMSRRHQNDFSRLRVHFQTDSPGAGGMANRYIDPVRADFHGSCFGWYAHAFPHTSLYLMILVMTTGERPPFHLAFPVHDLGEARAFYTGILGCTEGRSSEEWVDFDLHGHQIVAHLVPADTYRVTETNPVDGVEVPVWHFGLVLAWDAWEAVADRLRDAQIVFLVPPTVRFSGLPGEQASLFVRDPSGNALEFKAFRDPDQLFAK